VKDIRLAGNVKFYMDTVNQKAEVKRNERGFPQSENRQPFDVRTDEIFRET
jgi:hypothetical protein